MPDNDPDSLLATLSDTRRLLRIITAPTNVFGVDVSPDGRYDGFGGEDGLIRRWDLDSGEPVGEPLTGHERKSERTVLERRALDHLDRGGQDSADWDADTGAAIHVMTAQFDLARESVALSADGAVMAIGNRDGAVELLDVATGKQIGEPIRPQDGWVLALEFSPDGTRW